MKHLKKKKFTGKKPPGNAGTGYKLTGYSPSIISILEKQKCRGFRLCISSKFKLTKRSISKQEVFHKT